MPVQKIAPVYTNNSLVSKMRGFYLFYCSGRLLYFAAILSFQLYVYTQEFHNCQRNVCVVNDTVEPVCTTADCE